MAAGHGPVRGARPALILDALPDWFGTPEANDAHVAAADRLPMHVARTADGQAVGVLLIEQHLPETAEIHLMAVVYAAMVFVPLATSDDLPPLRPSVIRTPTRAAR